MVTARYRRLLHQGRRWTTLLAQGSHDQIRRPPFNIRYMFLMAFTAKLKSRLCWHRENVAFVFKSRVD